MIGRMAGKMASIDSTKAAAAAVDVVDTRVNGTTTLVATVVAGVKDHQLPLLKDKTTRF